MGIYIKGIEMPNSLAERGFVIRGDGRVRTFNGAVIDYTTAFPVPPHGRLIDADEFFKALTMDDRVSILEAMHVQSILSDAPTVIPAEGEGIC